MSKPLDWLKARAPVFREFPPEDQSAITDFALLWGFFENRILETNCSAAKIVAVVRKWTDEGILSANLFDDELAYFANRYFRDGDFTHRFHDLRFRNGDQGDIIRAVLSGQDTNAQHRVLTALIIVYRYRNNLFHGLKWEYEIAGQRGNFDAANIVLMKALDIYDPRQN
jgi:hypothetical protein